MTRLEKTLFSLLKPAVEGCGFVLWGIEYLPQGKHALLRVYIDHENGITVDDCGEVSLQASALLDVEDPVNGAYNLEISSPGLERYFFMPEHYRAYCGSRIKVSLLTPVQTKRRYMGEIVSADNETVILDVESVEVAIPLHNVQKAKVLAEYDSHKGKA